VRLRTLDRVCDGSAELGLLQIELGKQKNSSFINFVSQNIPHTLVLIIATFPLGIGCPVLSTTLKYTSV